jgi:hypothetical protein
MLKTSKKALANNLAKKNEEANLIEAYKKDMEESQEQKLLREQKAKYLVYVNKKLETWASDFLYAMQFRLEKGVPLTPNMTAALDKCIERDSKLESKPEEPVDESKLPRIVLKMKQWWIKEHKLDARVISGVVLRETDKA